MKVRQLQEKRGWACRRGRHPEADLMALTKHDWIDGEKIPAHRRLRGGGQPRLAPGPDDPRAVPLRPRAAGRYLTKDALFRTPVLKYIVKDASRSR